MLREHSQAFAQDETDLGQTLLLEYEIDTQGLPPFKSKFRPIPFKDMEWLKTEFERIPKARVIRPAKIPYSSPIVIVAKTAPCDPPMFRLCIDYRWLNEQNKKDAFTIPRIQALLPRLAKARFFSYLGLASCYHQVPMAQDAVEKSAFSNTFGHFEFLRMPFGLTNASATFQRLMNHIFADRLDEDILIYLDDIILFS